MKVHPVQTPYLEDIDALSRDVTQKIILFVKMAAEHLG